jgi:UDPglucose 6-dehydrogenase
MRDRVCVVGAGYVGLTTAACFAAAGINVVCVEIQPRKLAELARGHVAIYEPGLRDRVRTGLRDGTLSFTASLAAAAECDVTVLCLPTPMDSAGTADLSTLIAVVGQLRGVLADGSVLVTKSTAPVGTAQRIQEILGRPGVAVVSNPEFLREGHADADFEQPARIDIGAESPDAAERVTRLYRHLAAQTGSNAPVLVMTPESAELSKYASNCFLALKLSYVNSMAELCEAYGADISDVCEVMARDDRIGAHFLRPGPGWGGSCLPKDTHALRAIAAAADVPAPLLDAGLAANRRQVARAVDKARRATAAADLAGVRIGVLGLAFKAGTSDVRDSPAFAIVAELCRQGALVTAFDPAVTAEVAPPQHGLTIVDDPYLAAKAAQVIVLLTEWPQFRDLDWGRMAAVAQRAAVVDMRNHLDGGRLRELGFSYEANGLARR